MPYLCGAVLTATYIYILLLSVNTAAQLEDNDADPAININDSNNNNYLKRQLKKYHWRQYQLHQHQRHHHHHQEHNQTPELPRKEPLFERSQEITSKGGRTRSHDLRHHSRSSSSRRHRVSISQNTFGAGDDDHASGVGDVTSGPQRLNKGKKLLFRDRGLRIEVFEDIIGKLLQLSRDGSVQRAQISAGILGLAMDPNYYELWKEGSQKQDQQQQQLLQLYLQRQQQQKEQQDLAHRKQRHSVYVCPKEDSSFQLACPGLDSSGTTTCIRDTELCDGVIHCPDEEDENSTVCMFYMMIRNAINKITQTLFENLPRK